MERGPLGEKPIIPAGWRWPMETYDLIQTDPLGSYTGIPEDPEEKPVQDADDL